MAITTNTANAELDIKKGDYVFLPREAKIIGCRNKFIREVLVVEDIVQLGGSIAPVIVCSISNKPGWGVQNISSDELHGYDPKTMTCDVHSLNKQKLYQDRVTEVVKTDSDILSNPF